MKKSDYAPRAAAFDTYLKPAHKVGIEIGTDVGAHAEALLKYCDIEFLFLVDTWTNPFCKGYCEGRLHCQGFMKKVDLIQTASHEAALRFSNKEFDFIYIDITHDYPTVKQSLRDWWPLLRQGGIMGYRNYSESNPDLKRAIDELIIDTGCSKSVERYHNEIILWK